MIQGSRPTGRLPRSVRGGAFGPATLLPWEPDFSPAPDGRKRKEHAMAFEKTRRKIDDAITEPSRQAVNLAVIAICLSLVALLATAVLMIQSGLNHGA